MKGDELLALAERVEALSGPDREIDALIGAAMHVRGWHAADCLGQFTTSLDAAMTLVPEGCNAWAVAFVDDLVTGKEFIAGVAPDAQHRTGSTPALALCAAALRALAHREQSQ